MPPDDTLFGLGQRPMTQQPYRTPTRVRRSDGQVEVWVEGLGYVPQNDPRRLSAQDRDAIKDARDHATALSQQTPYLNRFEHLNNSVPTGSLAQRLGTMAHVPRLLTLDTNKDPSVNSADQYDEMQSIVNRMTPGARQGLPGSSSNLDVQMFQGALPSIGNRGPANSAIINNLRGEVRDAQNYAEFLDWYWPQVGSLGGAQEAYDGFRAAQGRNPQLSWRQYFAQNPLRGAAPRQQQQAGPMSHMSDEELERIANGG